MFPSSIIATAASWEVSLIPNYHLGYTKCFIIAVVANKTQATLNHMIVGRVFIVDVSIRARLETSAKM